MIYLHGIMQPTAILAPLFQAISMMYETMVVVIKHQRNCALLLIPRTSKSTRRSKHWVRLERRTRAEGKRRTSSKTKMENKARN